MIATVLDQYAAPNGALLLGLDILEADAAKGWVRIAFEAKADFCNASGTIQGGFLATMLDDSMGPAILIHTKAELLPSTIDLHVSYLPPARPGRLFGESRVTQLGKTVGFAQAHLPGAERQMTARRPRAFGCDSWLTPWFEGGARRQTYRRQAPRIQPSSCCALTTVSAGVSLAGPNTGPSLPASSSLAKCSAVRRTWVASLISPGKAAPLIREG